MLNSVEEYRNTGGEGGFQKVLQVTLFLGNYHKEEKTYSFNMPRQICKRGVFFLNYTCLTSLKRVYPKGTVKFDLKLL